MFFVSIIIPAYKAMDHLPACLDSLARQSWPAADFEVIVVDNGGNPGLESLIETYANVFLVDESQPSSYAARNRGLAEARGEFIVFTDADCIAHEDFLRAGIEALQAAPGIGLAGGRVVLREQRPDRPTAVELYEIEFTFTQEEYIEVGQQASTANIFTSVEVIEKVGKFDPELKSGGDFEWSHRVYEAGFKLVYAPYAIVYHPTRGSFAALAERTRRIAGGRHDVNRNDFIGGLAFIRKLAASLLPVRCWQRLWQAKNLAFWEKFKIYLVLVGISLVRVEELLQLRWGRRQPRRS